MSRPGRWAVASAAEQEADQAANRKKRGSVGGRSVCYDAEQCLEGKPVERCINELRAGQGLATR